MALVNLENKKQIIIIFAAVAVGLVAAVMVGNFVTNKIAEDTQRMAIQFEKAQKQREQQYNEQLAAMQQKIAQVEVNAKKSAEDAARAAAEKAKAAEGAKPKRKGSLALRTPVGKRAVTVLIDSLGAVGGLVNPGDFVDVIAHLNVPVEKKYKDKTKNTDTKDVVTAMLFQNLQVLAINTNLDDPGAYDDQQKEKALKITFAVDPQEAGLLAFAEKNGTIELALRAPNEKGRAMLSTATWSSLADYVLENNGSNLQVTPKEPTVVEEKPKEQAPSIQIYRGGKEL